MIKNHLSRLLGERRISQAALAKKTGIRPATINDIYHELAERISVEHVDKICEALDCDITELFEYIPNNIHKTGNNLIVEKHGNRKQKHE